MVNRYIAALLSVLLITQGFAFGQSTQSASALQSKAAQGACEKDPNSADCVSAQQNGNAQPAANTPSTNSDSEFQQFVESSLGRTLPLFGFDLFENVPTTFAPVDRIPVPADYVIGPGDELLVRAWGQIDVDAKVTVDRTGTVFLPKVGSINVAGVKYQQLPDYLRSSVGRVFRNFDLTVTLGQLRSIQVFVVGHARRPGSYTVSSLSTLVNALFASGGPSRSGSMRHIQLKRNGKVVTEFDIYDLLQKGDKSKDVLLLPGDVIFIPPAGQQVAMAGSVNFPAIYELRNGATLAEEIEAAGGLTSVADGQRVIVERIENHSTRKVAEFTLDDPGLKRTVQDGDLVRVFSISPKFSESVAIRGNVAQPGRYPWREGMRVHDLIPSREFLLTRAYWQQQNIVSTSSDEASWGTGTGWDKPKALVTTSGPKSEDRNGLVHTVADINWDYALVQRIDPVSLATSLIPFNLGKALAGDTSEDNLPLRAGDVITIFSQTDVAVAIDRRSKIVRVEGEFAAPGMYKVAPGETLRSVMQRAGGLTPNAYTFGTQFTRESARVAQEQNLQQMLKDLEIELERQTITSASTKPEQQEALKTEYQSQRALIQKLSAIKPVGRLVLEIDSQKTGADAIPDLALEDGDRIYVPHVASTVNVVGSVFTQNSYLYRKNMRVKDYVKLAGNGNRDADLKHAFIVRANGSIVSKASTSGMWSGGFDSIRVLPGDTIVIPAKLDRGSFVRGLKDWSQILGQFGLAAAAIGVWAN